MRAETHRALSGQYLGNTATHCGHCGTQGRDNVETDKVKMTREYIRAQALDCEAHLILNSALKTRVEGALVIYI